MYEPANTSTAVGRPSPQGGLLVRLAEIPLDVLFEILNHLHPLELLYLARTTKSLRGVLMRRSSVSVWRAAISNIHGLPSCPLDLTEPQYVNLAFDSHCHFCLASNVQDIYWSCRVRCCKSCVETHFISDFDLKRRIPRDPGDGRYKAIFPYIVYPKPRPYSPGRILYYLPVAEQYIRELSEIKSNDGTVREWSKEKKEEQSRRLSHAALCESWSSHWVRKRSQGLGAVVLLSLLVALFVIWRGDIMD